MKKIVSVFALLLVLTGASYAQNPEPPKPAATIRLHAPKDHWYKDKYFWIGAAIIAGSIAADGHSTSLGRSRGLVEGNPVLGSHPSNGKIVGVSSLAFGIQFALHIAARTVSHDDPNQAWRQFGRWAVPGVVVSINGRNAVNNYKKAGVL
jgi:hypothetical protein